MKLVCHHFLEFDLVLLVNVGLFEGRRAFLQLYSSEDLSARQSAQGTLTFTSLYDYYWMY